MGACGSKSTTVNIEAASWTEAYERHASNHGDRTRTLRRQGTFSEGGANIVKSGTALRQINDYTVAAALGKGAYGEVFLASRRGEKYAIKVLKKSKLKKMGKPMRPGMRMTEGLSSIKVEIATMKKIAHPNCVALYDVILDPLHDDVFLVLEYVDGGPSQRSDKEGNPIPIPERTIWSHTRHLLMGLEYLHMNGIVHRDIKPDNLLLTQPGRMWKGGKGVLKIADFGTSCFCEGDANAQKTAGTPIFFSPELCATGTSGTYDGRVVDLWAVGVTLYMWVSGKAPINAPTTAMLMEAVRAVEGHVPAPKEASALLGGVIEGLMTTDPADRLTLNQLRLSDWLTDGKKEPMPLQPVVKVEVTPEEIALAVTNRATIKVGSAAGPSFLGTATGDSSSGWTREGEAIIRKRTSEGEGLFFQAIAASGHLAPHIPIIYSIDCADADHATASKLPQRPASPLRANTPGGGRPATPSGLSFLGSFRSDASLATAPMYANVAAVAANEASDGEASAGASVAASRDRATSAYAAPPQSADEEASPLRWDVRMQDLVAQMTSPCAVSLIMGTRTLTPADLQAEALGGGEPRAELLASMREHSPNAPTAAEVEAGGVTFARYLAHLDEATSTSTLGFRIDAAKTMVGKALAPLPLPDGISLATLREEEDLCAALSTFLQRDAALARQVLLKVETLQSALQRSHFFPKHAFLRSTLLLVYDDTARTSKLELKMMNFGHSFAMPEGQTLQHNVPWDGTGESFEDGYLTGVASLHRVVARVCEELEK